MNIFQVTKDRRVFLDGHEIPRCLGFNVEIDAEKDPEVVLRVACESVSIEEYTKAWTKQKESQM